MAIYSAAWEHNPSVFAYLAGVLFRLPVRHQHPKVSFVREEGKARPSTQVAGITGAAVEVAAQDEGGERARRRINERGG